MRKIKTAEVLAVGTEILIGDIVNTDAAYISKGLASLGISQYRQTVVGDNGERLKTAVSEALSRSELLIMTGGLGPTYDDITKETAASLMGKKLVLNEDSLRRIKSYFERRGKIMTENNVKQAMMPEDAYIFENHNGTADGCAIDDAGNGKMIIMLPGPPRELEPMFKNQVMPFLSQYTDGVLVSKNVNIIGMGESEVESHLRERMEKGVNPTEAPYCLDGECRIRVTAYAKTADEGYALCDRDIEEIRKTPVGKFIYGIDTTVDEAVVRILAEKGLTLFAAESCTGGLVAKHITDVPGASAVFMGGIVSYTNEIKMKTLGVSPDTLEKHTAVSRECAAEMAQGARKVSGASIGVSTTGYASPGIGVPEDKVGLIYVAVSDRNGTVVSELRLTGDRAKNREGAVKNLLKLLLDRIND